VEMNPRQRNMVVVGALIGAVLGAGAAWLLINNPVDSDGEVSRTPIAPGEVLKLTSRVAFLMRDMNDLRRRV
jgi:hypothetical protein